MRKLLLTILIIWLMAAIACQEEAPSPENNLIAHAGVDQQATVNTLVQLDGSLSEVHDQRELTYHWSFLSKPEASVATLINESTLAPTFVPDQAGIYIIELWISTEFEQSNDQVLISAVIPEHIHYIPFFEDSVVSYEHNPAIDIDQDGETDYLFTADYFSFSDHRVELQFRAVSTLANQLVVYEDQALSYSEKMLISDETIYPYEWDIQNALLLTRVDRSGTISWQGAWKDQRKKYLAFRLRKDEQTMYYGWVCLSADEEGERMILHNAAYVTIPASFLLAGQLEVLL